MEHYAAVIIGVWLGDGLGFDLVKKMRQRPSRAYLPVAMTSVQDSFAHRVAALEAGATMFLAKPVSETTPQTPWPMAPDIGHGVQTLGVRSLWLPASVGRICGARMGEDAMSLRPGLDR